MRRWILLLLLLGSCGIRGHGIDIFVSKPTLALTAEGSGCCGCCCSVKVASFVVASHRNAAVRIDLVTHDDRGLLWLLLLGVGGGGHDHRNDVRIEIDFGAHNGWLWLLLLMLLLCGGGGSSSSV